ncbi:sigma-54-dependent transcriptional regulator [Fulvivirga lutea]|uniref:Sigma-54-dependent Fis family transcriptional regulator n=1 Tax=Fulvivirga lutea TaxID=2810512 RepID=A0A974ZZB7_9BACT|nr:sigma-54 dependent transcriptional regulator [Fulvivirga lutea]QSE95901.1 sigma-54-dependent Fis family transcriptional regulator [Fulvivirga lutea]
MIKPASRSILIIDGDESISIKLNKYLSKKGFNVLVEDSVQSALSLIKKEKIDLVITDFELAKYTGIELLQKVKIYNPAIQVIIVTAYAEIRLAVEALKKGAFDYVTKPLFPDEILDTINNALEARLEALEQPKVSNRKSNKVVPKYINGSSYQSQLVEKHIDLIAPTDMSVIISGETGTGKEYVARRIHMKSKRNNMPFVAVDCGTLPHELAGSELFGHVKGAFTGALSDHKGCFERAHGGTLFLDEIGNLSYENQVQLLRALQEGVIRPVGGSKEIRVNVRVLVATNEDLKMLVEKGNFREDIYHRLNEFKIDLAPLRERNEDIEIFAAHFLKLANTKLKKNITGFSVDVLEKFKMYDWPGNLRELQNMIKRAVLICKSDKIEISCLPPEITQLKSFNDLSTSIMVANGTEAISLREITERAERGAILEVLRQTDYNKTKTASLLQIDRKTLYNKMKSLKIVENA